MGLRCPTDNPLEVQDANDRMILLHFFGGVGLLGFFALTWGCLAEQGKYRFRFRGRGFLASKSDETVEASEGALLSRLALPYVCGIERSPGEW